MAKPVPIYTVENTNFAFQLLWSVAIFWKERGAGDAWLPELKTQCEAAGLRILQHRLTENGCSLFLVSTRPQTTGSEVIRGIKGRLQALVRKTRPNVLRRNYELHSIGSTTRDKTEAYVARQLDHHDIDPEQIRSTKLDDLQFINPDVDLGKLRFTSHGRFVCNLHIGFRFTADTIPLSANALGKVRSVVRRTADRHGFFLSRFGLLEDHVHLVIGIATTDSPAEVAVSFMNNIAWVFKMHPVLWKSCYIGTIGEFNLGAVRENET